MSGRWAVIYSSEVTEAELAPFDLLVLDDRHHPPIEPLRAAGKQVLVYLSAGEVEKTRPYFGAVEMEGSLVEENPNWSGAFRIDLRDKRWQWRLIERIIPSLLAQGFDGLFLDTLDTAGYLESLDPVRFAGMTAAAAELVQRIRTRFPQARIMMNRGFALLPAVESSIDALLAESAYARYDFERKTYGLTPEAEYAYAKDLLRALRARRPELAIYSLDYWNPGDAEGIRRIYQVQRANGFRPYVSTILLNGIVPEPAP
jgi:uncharacterized protein (TIGR01370 family)